MAKQSVVLWRPAAQLIPARGSNADVTRAPGASVAYARVTDRQADAVAKLADPMPHIIVAAGRGRALVGLLWQERGGTVFLAFGSYAQSHADLERALGSLSGADPKSDGTYAWGGEVTLASLAGRRAVGTAVAVNDRCGLLRGCNALPPNGPHALGEQLRDVGPVQFTAGFAVIADRDAPEILDGHVGARRLDRHTEIVGGLHSFVLLNEYVDDDAAVVVSLLQREDGEYAQRFATLAAIFPDTLYLLQREVAVLVGGMRRMARGEELTIGEWAQFAGAFQLVVPRMAAACKSAHVDVYRLPKT